MTVPILNASGCLDALTAPEVAVALDAFVTKTITPLPRDGNQPVRIAETDAGMLNSIGLQGPGIDGLVDQTLPALSRLGIRVWVSVGGFSVDDYAGICERLEPGHDVLACGPEPMLEAVRDLVPEAQLAWEAPMACGFGACYGCVVEVDGRLQRLCIAGPVLRAA